MSCHGKQHIIVGNTEENRNVTEISRKEREEKTLKKLTGMNFETIENFDENEMGRKEGKTSEKTQRRVQWHQSTQFRN